MDTMKDKYVSKRYWKGQVTPMGKVADLAARYDDVIPLSLGDPDIITDERIIEKAFEDAKAGHTKYTDFRGDPELRDEVAKFYQEEYGVQVEDEEIFIIAGACVGMYLVLESILDDNDEVIMQSPYFTPYKQQVELARGIPIELDTFEGEGFQVNPERLESLITERTKAIIINTPSNPTGNCQTRETMMAIGEIAKKYDLLVIADDIYTAYSFAEPFIPIMSLPGMKDRTITINSASKDFAMTGWRIGNIVAPPNIIKIIQLVNENMVFTAPSISQRAMIYALRNRHDIQPPLIAEYRKRVDYAAQRINDIPKMSVLTPPSGTFYLFVNIKQTGLSSEEVSLRILEEAHVVTIPGIAFGTCGEGYMRIACTHNIDTLKEAFDRIEKMNLFK